MRRFTLAMLLLLPATLVFTTVSGCKKAEVEEEVPATPAKYKKSEGTGATGGKAEPLKAASMDGVLTGRIVFDGTPPEMPPIAEMSMHKDKAGCLSGMPFEHNQQTWIIGKDNAVGNVVVWLEGPKGKFFQLDEKETDRSKEEVILDQPHCVFIPHVVAVFPSYFDGTEQKTTGQVFKAKNSAGFTHNTKWSGDPLKGNSGTVTLGSGSEQAITLKATRSKKEFGKKDIVNFACDIHPWMQARGFVFDTPFHDVTRAYDAKRTDGVFEIKNVPTGVELTPVLWHEAKGEFRPLNGITLKAGEKMDLGDIKIK